MHFSEIFQFIFQAAYLHDLSPFAIKFTDSLGIRWYGLSYLAGFFAAYLIILNLSKKNKISLSKEKVSDFVFYAAVGAILGGRIGYCLFYDTSLLSKFTSSFPFWGVLEVNHGGMASHGGILGVLIACLLYAKREALPKLELLDLVALTACLGIMFGRIANFVNGELVGRPAQEDYAFAVKFPQDLLSLQYANINQLSDFAQLAYSLGYSKPEVEQALNSHSTYFFENIASKAIEQIQNGNQSVKDAASQILVARHPSQLYEAGLEGLFLFVLILIARKIWPKNGVASSVFLIAYPLVRILGEQFRMPDAQIGFQMFGLTRGQWISILMLVIGILYLVIVLTNKKTEKPA